jgi:cobalt-zinc-cadmium efflux system membrane fusion protein
VFSKDLPLIKKGQTCQIASEIQTLEGRISFLSPVLDPATRTATARVVMDNADGNLRPGTATVSGKTDAGILIVPVQAVQTVDGKAVVFVKAGDAYTLRPVAVGRRTPSHVEILLLSDAAPRAMLKSCPD